MGDSEHEPVDLTELASAVAVLSAEVRATRADAGQDAVELRARTRWLEGRIEALETALGELAALQSPPAEPVSDEAPVASTARRTRQTGAGTGEKRTKAARIKATMSVEEIERARTEKQSRRG